MVLKTGHTVLKKKKMTHLTRFVITLRANSSTRFISIDYISTSCVISIKLSGISKYTLCTYNRCLNLQTCKYIELSRNRDSCDFDKKKNSLCILPCTIFTSLTFFVNISE